MAVHRAEIEADGRGRILLPREARDALGITAHAVVSVELTEDGAVILRDPIAERSRRLRAAQGRYAGTGGSVDDLIAERRAEAARDDSQT